MNPSENLDYNRETNTLTVRDTDGVRYRAGGQVLEKGEHKLTRNTTVRAYPRGRLFDEDVETEWHYKVTENSEGEAVDSTESDGSQDNEVEDTPVAPTAGSTPQAPGQGAGTPTLQTPGTPGGIRSTRP